MKSLTKPSLFWLLLLGLFGFEIIVFRYHLLKDIVPFYPAGFDQDSYLTVTYTLFDSIQKYGFISGIKEVASLANGFLFPLQAIISMKWFGANRVGALLPNFFYYFTLQIITLLVLSRLTNKKYILFLMFGMMLCINTSLELTGSIFDFRMDAIAFSLYGIITALVIQSQIFLKRTSTILIGVCSLLMILTRVITMPYIMGLLGCMLLYFIYCYKTTSDTHLKQDYKTRLVHCLGLLFIYGSIIFIYIWLNREMLYNYYIVGHLLNNEKHIRAAEAHIHTSWQLLLYYPIKFFNHQFKHAGSLLIIALFSVYIVPAILKRFVANSSYQLRPALLNKLCLHIAVILSKAKDLFSLQMILRFAQDDSKTVSLTKPLRPDKIPYWRDGFVFLLLALSIPIGILTLDESKSPIVGYIISMPFLWLVIWLTFYFDAKQKINKTKYIILQIITALMVLVGLSNIIKQCFIIKRPFNQQELVTLNQMNLDISRYVQSEHLTHFVMSTDRIVDHLLYTNIIIAQFEKNGVLLKAQPTEMGGTIFDKKFDDLIASLHDSHVVIMNLSNNYPVNSPYPADQQIAKYKPELLQYAEQHFKVLGDYQVKDSIYRVYVKNTI